MQEVARTLRHVGGRFQGPTSKTTPFTAIDKSNQSCQVRAAPASSLSYQAHPVDHSLAQNSHDFSTVLPQHSNSFIGSDGIQESSHRSTGPESRRPDVDQSLKSLGFRDGDTDTADDFGRIQSNGFASSSSGATLRQGDLDDLFLRELRACEELEDVMEMALEESGTMDGAWISACLLRCVSIVKAHKSKGKGALPGVNNGEAVAVLLQLVQREASKMNAADLVMSLWSLATMNTKVLRVLKVLQREIDVRLAELNERELALTAWSYATLNHHPGIAADRLSQAAIPRLQGFKPQGLSMMMWAFGKLEHTPSAEFTGGVISQMHNYLPDFSPQSVANIVHASGKLRYELSLRHCQMIEELICADATRYKDIELANIFYGFVKSRYRPQQLLNFLEDRVQAGANLEHGQSPQANVFGMLFWGAGVLGMPLRASSVEALSLCQAKGMLRDWNSLAACNIVWGLSKLGEIPVEPIKHELSLIVANTAPNKDGKLWRQLYQAVTTCRLLDIELDLPEGKGDTERMAQKWWHKAQKSVPPSITALNVSEVVRSLRVPCESQLRGEDGMPTIDVAIDREDDSKLAIMVVNPQEFSMNDGQPLGRILSNTRLLDSHGWEVVTVKTSDLPDFQDKPKLIQFLGKLLEEHGVPTEWSSLAESADRPAPSGIRNNLSRGSSVVTEPIRAKQRQQNAVDASESDDEEEDLDLVSVNESVQTKYRSHSGADVGPKQLNGLRRVPGTRGGPTASPLPNGRNGALNESSGAAIAARLDREALEKESPEAQREKELQAIERRKHVAKQLSGDFMEGWESFADWKALRRVEPNKS